MTEQKQKRIPERKVQLVGGLSDLIKNKRTTLIASIKNIPASQFQEIVKKLRKNVIVKVPKKSLANLAIDKSGDEKALELKEKIGDSTALMFSDLDSYELAAELMKNTSPAKAKPGQEAPEDIIIEEGPTSLTPGPAISELGALGIQIQIEKGKIHIKKSKVIVPEGGKISAAAADLMSKMDIKPFEIGFIPLAAYDSSDGKVYFEIKIDSEGTINDMKNLYAKALAFAVEIGYSNEDTIKFMIGKAGAHGLALEKLMDVKENKEEAPKEEKKEELEEKPTEEEKVEDNTQKEKTEEEK